MAHAALTVTRRGHSAPLTPSLYCRARHDHAGRRAALAHDRSAVPRRRRHRARPELLPRLCTGLPEGDGTLHAFVNFLLYLQVNPNGSYLDIAAVSNASGKSSGSCRTPSTPWSRCSGRTCPAPAATAPTAPASPPRSCRPSWQPDRPHRACCDRMEFLLPLGGNTLHLIKTAVDTRSAHWCSLVHHRRAGPARRASWVVPPSSRSVMNLATPSMGIGASAIKPPARQRRMPASGRNGGGAT